MNSWEGGWVGDTLGAAIHPPMRDHRGTDCCRNKIAPISILRDEKALSGLWWSGWYTFLSTLSLSLSLSLCVSSSSLLLMTLMSPVLSRDIPSFSLYLL